MFPDFKRRSPGPDIPRCGESFDRPRGSRILIVGGSTRAAAWSARRAGFQPVCADLFADRDTRQVADVIPVRNYPDSLPDDVAHVQADGWFFTGALENRPDLIERMDRPDAPYGPLWGVAPAELRLLRDPFWVADTLKRGGHSVLEVRPETSTPPADGTWMRKPINSAGGRAVCRWDNAGRNQNIHEPVYFQRVCHGEVLSAVFRCCGHDVALLGMTRQLPGHRLSGAAEPYLYAGSAGPVFPAVASTAHVESENMVLRQMQSLADACELQGLVGIDFVRDHQGTPWVLEVNPRYTASVEVLELAFQKSMINSTEAPAGALRATDKPSYVMKLVLYAPRSLMIGDLGPESNDFWSLPSIADIPASGTRIEEGWPICTVFSHGITEEESVARLQRRVDTVWKMVNYRVDDPSYESNFAS